MKEEKLRRIKSKTVECIKERHDNAAKACREMGEKLFVENENEILLEEIEDLLRRNS